MQNPVIDDRETKCWYLNDELHREDGPAVEYAAGDKCWYLNGKLHREDGPAVEWADGYKEWWLNGKYLTEEQFNEHKEEKEQDAKIDRYHDGYFAQRRGEARPDNSDAAAGWDEALNDSKICVIMPRRPEGYYHCKLGTFE